MNQPEQKISFFFPLKGFIAVSLLHVIFWLPNSITQMLGRFSGWLLFRLSAKKRNTMLTNLEIAFPETSQSARVDLAKQSAMQAGLLLSEFPDAWLGSQQKIEQQIIAVKNAELVTEIHAKGKPLVVIAPHIGNWEFLVQWIQLNFPIIGLYSPSKIPQIDRLIFNARKKFGCKPYSTDSKGVLQLLKGLKQGGIMVMLPDQVPRKNAGIYTPFFGQPAYTMTLLHRLVKKSKARVLFASCIRREDKKGFDIEFEQPFFDESEPEVDAFNLAMNQQIERVITRYPEQYVWDYKRYKRQQDGRNLYKSKAE